MPVVDSTGKVLFSPEMYDHYRAAFAGVERYDGGAIEIVRTGNEREEIQNIVAQIKEELPVVESFASEISTIVREILRENDVHLREQNDLAGAELIDTGSTERHTNIPGIYSSPTSKSEMSQMTT